MRAIVVLLLLSLTFGCEASASAGSGAAFQARQVPNVHPVAPAYPQPTKRQGFTRQQDLQIDAFEARERRSLAHVDPYQAQQKAIAAHNDRVIADERERRIHMSELASDPRYAVTAMSAAICQMKGDIKELEADIARERRVGQTGGVVDLRRQHEAAERIEDSRDNIRDWTKHLREKFGVGPTACTDMRALLACHDDHEACTPETAEQDDLLRNGTDELQR